MFAFITNKLLLMKRIQLLNLFLVFVLAFQFTACDNEPLEGEFPQEGDPGGVEDGQFIATIEGASFSATAASGVLYADNVLSLTGLDSGTGETISITVEEAGVGSFVITAGLGPINIGSFIDGTNPTNPYTTIGEFGGSGQLNITELNTTDLTVSGNFSFIGVRPQLDSEGNPVLDGEGNPIIETKSIAAGEFVAIPYILDTNNGGGGDPGDGGGTTPESEFFAHVDEIPFTPVFIETTKNVIGEHTVISVLARNEIGASIRVDIPETLGEGTFDMESLSDGTKLIGLYNANTGGENLTSNPGTITITEFDTEAGKIVATFEFTATDPLNVDPAVSQISLGEMTLYYEGTPGAVVDVLSADIDGETFIPESISAIKSPYNGITIVTISAVVGTENITLNFPADIEPGTYSMEPGLELGEENVGRYTPEVGVSLTYTSNPGILTIVSNDVVTGVIEGNFAFLATDATAVDPTTFEITNGSFLVEAE